MESFFRNKPMRGQVMLEMPAEVLYRAIPEDFEVTRKDHAGTITFTWWNKLAGEKIQVADAYALRTAFFAAKTAEEAHGFLTRCGPFRSDHVSVTWAYFQKWQDYFKRQRLLEAGFGAPPEHNDTEALHRVIGEPHIRTWPIERKGGKRQVTLLLECDSAVEAIAATIYLDKRLGIKTRTCKECGDVFEPATKRARFCGRSCIHQSGQKRRRNVEPSNAKA